MMEEVRLQLGLEAQVWVSERRAAGATQAKESRKQCMRDAGHSEDPSTPGGEGLDSRCG